MTAYFFVFSRLRGWFIRSLRDPSALRYVDILEGTGNNKKDTKRG